MVKYFVANLDSVAAEIFDGEMVVINFQSGTYFSFSGSAPLLWQMLQTPQTVDELAGAFIPDACREISDIHASVETFINTLLREDCVKQIEDPPPGRQANPAIEARPFSEPQVRIFHDLKDLIAIDPVHEADEFEGWPHRPPLVGLE